ncbi:hypothetical protein RT970_002123 [Staphylococcus pseudintermedius]|nr:hypothetical protein [Staphylococcus pseudintermedius]
MDYIKFDKFKDFHEYIKSITPKSKFPILEENHKIEISLKFKEMKNSENMSDNYKLSKHIIISIGKHADVIAKSASIFLERENLHFNTIEEFTTKFSRSVHSILFIISPGLLDSYSQNNLIEFFKQSHMKKTVYGIIYGKNLSLLSFHLYKNVWLFKYGNDSCDEYLTFSDNIETYNSNNYINLSKKQSSINHINSEILNNKDWINFLSITTGTVDDFTFTKNEVICGKSMYKSDEIKRKKLPQCELGYECLISNLPLQKTNSIYSKVLLLQGCNSAKLDSSEFGPDFDLGYSFLESNVCAYIGTPRLVGVNNLSEIFFKNLVYSGYSLGEATNYLNQALEYQGIDTHGFILFGDPLFKFYSKKDRHDYKYNDDILHVKNLKDSSLISIISKHKIDNYYLLNEDTSKYKYQKFSLMDLNSNYIIHFISFNTLIEEEELLFKNNKINNLELLGTHIKELCINLNTEKFKSNVFKHNNIYTEINNKLIYLNENLSSFKSLSQNNTHKFFKELQELHSLVDKYQSMNVKNILKLIRRNGFNYDSLSENNSTLSFFSHSTSKNCMTCNHKISIRKKNHLLFPEYSRVLEVCPSCNNMYEYPNQKRLSVEWNAKTHYVNNKTNKIDITIKNNSSSLLCLNAGIEFNHSIKDKIYTLSPNTYNKVLNPYEKITWSIDFSFENIPPHVQKFTVIMFADLELYVYKNNFIPIK